MGELKIKKMKYLALCTLIVLSSCTKLFDDYYPIESDINFIIEWDNTDEIYYLKCNTEDLYSHSGWGIIYDKNVLGNKITINFKRIKDGGTGLLMISPASAWIELKIEENKEYDLVFKLNGQKSKYKYSLTDSITVEEVQAGNVHLQE